ncbi:MAG: hypothetical protein QM755_17050 [Luteolibacter sp.]
MRPQRTLLKVPSGYASGILNAPDPSYDPTTTIRPSQSYDVDNLAEGKIENKLVFQAQLGLKMIPMRRFSSGLRGSTRSKKAPNCSLISSTSMVTDYSACKLQIAVIASGAYQSHFHRHRGISTVFMTGWGGP